ncbi:PREDICTED: CLAVATA3/ESR (CLE)-related protein 25-like [Nelumbo nucifera]|uniref:CLAVATA3/ESR (CLE)-related protein 25-like n=2 Tax=Nelumbo nucifera TaxID=4432 RepID=A0A822YJJ8_NELNU|nr:PREDICTED: CLAVATA3/ESR (CLE)-related protein 25-like [Nelumbo nucifera]DAD31106.1 TPA_asm: hypothetical protein HUJ06_009957 [Nelumbo nucifera]
MRKSMGYASRCSRVLFGAFVFVCFVAILCCVEIVAGGGITTVEIATPSTRSLKHLEVLTSERPSVQPDLDLNYMSKRRVPNGPDPIHNRRAGKSRQPPGRA